MSRLLLNLSLLTLAFQVQAASIYDPMSRVDFWRRHFQEVTVEQSPLVGRAQQIFDKVLSTAGNRYGVQPRLLVLEIGRPDIQLPVAIQDGWIILSKQMLETLSKDNESMDSRLAFILGHEIAHQLEHDFWSVKFFNAVQTYSRDRGLASKDIAPEAEEMLRRMSVDSNELAIKELKADEQGIIYAAMAGYDVNRLFGVSSQRELTAKKNATESEHTFFRNWISSLYPETAEGAGDNSTRSLRQYPTLKERVTVVTTRLHEVYNHTKLFQLGIWFYYSEQFDKAAEAFEEFIRYFPEKSSHLNLAASYHQLAIQHSTDTVDNGHLPFKLSFDIDPYSNARFHQFRSVDSDGGRYEKYRDKAVKYYDIAISQDRQYVPALNNLACLYILDNRPYKAISLLQDAVALNPTSARLHSNIGVAFFASENSKKAMQHFEKSLALDPGSTNASLNLGLMAARKGDLLKAQEHWKRYLSHGTTDDWSRALRQHYKLADNADTPNPGNLSEALENTAVGIFVDEIPNTWHSLSNNAPASGNAGRQLLEYDNGVIAVSNDDEIQLIIATSGYAGQSSLRIKVGDNLDTVTRKYGAPNHRLRTTQGEALTYLSRGITFVATQNRVTSWILY